MSRLGENPDLMMDLDGRSFSADCGKLTLLFRTGLGVFRIGVRLKGYSPGLTGLSCRDDRQDEGSGVWVGRVGLEEWAGVADTAGWDLGSGSSVGLLGLG